MNKKIVIGMAVAVFIILAVAFTAYPLQLGVGQRWAGYATIIRDGGPCFTYMPGLWLDINNNHVIDHGKDPYIDGSSPSCTYEGFGDGDIVYVEGILSQPTGCNDLIIDIGLISKTAPVETIPFSGYGTLGLASRCAIECEMPIFRPDNSDKTYFIKGQTCYDFIINDIPLTVDMLVYVEGTIKENMLCDYPTGERYNTIDVDVIYPKMLPGPVEINGTLIRIDNPCNTEPCLPGIVWAVECDQMTYYLTNINNGLLWAERDIDIYGTFSEGDKVMVFGWTSTEQDIYGNDYNTIGADSITLIEGPVIPGFELIVLFIAFSITIYLVKRKKLLV